MTYALRVVAYQTKDKYISRFSKKNKEFTAVDDKFFALKYDKRNDYIFAFRVIRIREDGGITILWKELSKQKSPKIVFEKEEKLADFKD
jgi:hypothetical protein